ncbi:MAG: hypothetical protein HKN97_15560, partial [Myxococcales bacterium]|nr:hypothetical protein [Myxococcales bacterium]
MAKRTWLVLVLLVAGALVLWRQSRPEASAALVQWTGIAALVAPPADLTWERVDAYPEVKKAVEGSDPVRLREALQASGLRGLWVGVSAQARTGAHLPLRERLANGAVVRGFRGAVLT